MTVTSANQEFSATRTPSGVLQLTPAWRRTLPAQRGRPAGNKAPAIDKILEQLEQVSRHHRSPSSVITSDPQLSALLVRHPLHELLSAERLQQPDQERWRVALLIAQFLWMPRKQVKAASTLMQACLHWHGVVFANRCQFAALRQYTAWNMSFYLGDDAAGCAELAAALAGASDADFDAARADALAEPPAHAVERFARGAVFNTDPALIEDALAVVEGDGDAAFVMASGLIGAQLSLDQASRIIDSPSRRSFDDAVQPLALNLLSLHGEAAIPLLARLFDRPNIVGAVRARLAEILRAADSAAAFAVLLQQIAHKEVRPAIDGFARDYPRVAMQVAATCVQGSAGAAIQAWLEQMQTAHAHLLRPPGDSAAPKPASHDASPALAADAALDAMPVVLRDPPWMKAPKPLKLPDLPAVELPAPRMHWPEGLREQWRSTMSAEGNASTLPERGYPLPRREMALQRLRIPASLRAPLLADEITDLAPHLRVIEAEGRRHQTPLRPVGELAHLRPALRLLLWNSLPGFEQRAWDHQPASAAALIAHYELAALPGLLAFIGNDPEAGLAASLPVAAAAIAGHAARALGSKRARPAAMAWLRRHAELASSALLLQSARGGKADATCADAALRWLGTQVELSRLSAGASHFGAAGDARLQAILAVDPLAQLPQKPRPLPSFYQPMGFRRPRLHDGRALPPEALDALGTMLQTSRLDEPYAGLEQLKSACTSESLDAFAWDLFLAWERSDAPAREAWAFQAIGPIGGDDCVRALASLIRRWPAEGLSARAVTGLDILCAIGSDLALMHLHAIAQSAKSASLRDHAQSRIAAIAEARDLGPDDLADRLVPDLGLGTDGTLLLDFGDRRFTVSFDEQLVPFVRDASGTRLKDLPKATSGDASELAQAATERWKRLKKDAKAIAAQQIERLERLMCSGRRLDMAVFERCYLQHPLMRHLARRLLWGAYDAEGRVQALRIAEDHSFADQQDRSIKLLANAGIRPLHPLELDAGQIAAFVQIFADYTILQPFAQLAREVPVMADDELSLAETRRFVGRAVATGGLLGLPRSGWRAPEDKESGHIGWFEKLLPGGMLAQLRFEPGIPVVGSHTRPQQTLSTLSLQRPGTPCSFAQLDSISRSELLRDLDQLPPANA